MTIWANTIVENEENFLWFAVMSVADYVDKILIWDTGSDDKTILIIEELKKKLGDKIEFKEVGEVDEEQFTKMRQKMLEESDCDWILILDGDEIWWKDSIKKIVNEIKKRGKKIDGIVVPFKVSVGDIHHMQDGDVGRYKLLGRIGHFSLKALNRKIPGLHVNWPYGKEGFFDGNGKLVQEREKIVFVDAPFLHVTHLKRSEKKRKYEKFKYELGKKVSEDFSFPEVLYGNFPKIISSPWTKIVGTKLLKAKFLTPLRRLKRSIL